MNNNVTSQEPAPEDDQRFLSSVARAFSILEALSANPKSQSLTELSRTTNVTVPTLQRMTKTLEACGYLEKSERTKRYSPGIKTVDLLHNYLASNELAKTAWPHLVRLRVSTGLGVSFSVPVDDSMIYIHRLPSYRGDFENTLPGKMIPLHLSASGRCVLASWPSGQVDRFLEKIEYSELTIHTVKSASSLKERLASIITDGFCILEQEVSMGVSTIAVPVRAGTKVNACISIHASSNAWPRDQLVEEVSPRLLEVASALGTSSAAIFT